MRKRAVSLFARANAQIGENLKNFLGVPEMKSTQTTDRTITTADVKTWFGRSRQAQLADAQYEEIAARLTRFRWKNDPPDDPNSPWLPKPIKTDDKEWWDFKASLEAAKTLLESAPAMLRHWESLQKWPATRDGYETIKRLSASLSEAMPYIEWPFGKYQRQTGRKTPKSWNAPALVIAILIIRTMVSAGHANPAISKNSVVVRVVRSAMIRMEYGHIQLATIAAHLTAHDRKFGLTPRGIAALTKKHNSALFDHA